MAQAERESKPQGSTVASCAATDCRHNDDRNCTAGEIELQMQGEQVVCATYSPQKPRARP